MVKQGLSKVSTEALLEVYRQLEEDVSQEILDYYKTYAPDVECEIPVLYYFWVKVVATPSGESIPLFSKYIFAQNAYPALFVASKARFYKGTCLFFCCSVCA